MDKWQLMHYQYLYEEKNLNHFLQFGDKYYSQFMNAGYPRGLFVSKDSEDTSV